MDVIIRVFSIRDIYIRSAYTENIYAKYTYIEIANIEDISSKNIYIIDICIKSSFDKVENLIFWDSCICNSINNPYEFTVLNL